MLIPTHIAEAAITAAAEAFKLKPETITKALAHRGDGERPQAMTPAKLAIYRAVSEALALPLSKVPMDLKAGRPAVHYWNLYGEASVLDPYQRNFPHVKAAVLAAMEAAAA